MSLTEPEPEKGAAEAPEDSSDDKENTQTEETVTSMCEMNFAIKNSSMPSLILFRTAIDIFIYMIN